LTRADRIRKFLKRNGIMYKLFGWMFPRERRWFPSFIKKTDEERIQNVPHLLNMQGIIHWDITEKIDGQSATYFLVKHKFLWFTRWEFGICSRNVFNPTPAQYKFIANKYGIEEFLRRSNHNCDDFVAIQGEVYGVGIQGNKYCMGQDGRDIYGFKAFNIIVDGERMGNTQTEAILNHWCIDTVPFVAQYISIPETVEGIVEWSKGKSFLNEYIQREGIVVRSSDGSKSFKVINPDFLLKYDEQEEE